jgi:CheY-like chemotaxis protein/nitrogen-specific signal transduction histidine kinase/HPt (histidine-containing phosphotransfer) domain-containing protein
MEEIELQNDKLQAALETAHIANRTKSEFLAKVSHEIRTPMNAIIGMTELALREDMPASASEHIITAKQAGMNLLSIINDILDFSKIESDNVQIISDEYSLSSLLNDVINIIRMKTVDTGLRFVVNLDSNLPDLLFGDETKIRQVLVNILGNAVKYTDRGFVSLSISGKMLDDGMIHLTIEVKDSGRGIKKEAIGRLFESYYQHDVKTNRDVEGIGLGLTIAWNFVKAMDGDITVESEYRGGSTFTVTLPQRVTKYEKIASVDDPDKNSVIFYERREKYADSLLYTINNLGVKCDFVSDAGLLQEMLEKEHYPFIFIARALYERNKDMITKLAESSQIVFLSEFGESIPEGDWSVMSMPVHAISIANIFNGVSDRFSYNTRENMDIHFTAPEAAALIVDDLNTNLKVAKGLLMPYEIDVDLCSSGAEAIKAVQNKRYDIVFMDHRMPVMDGVEAVGHIRALGDDEPYFMNLPIVALTANAVFGVKEIFLQNGFDDFLSKPIDTVQLNTILEKWIPNDMQTRRSARIGDDEVVSDKSPLSPGLALDGVDIAKGIRQSGGTLDFYFETLGVFYEDGTEKKSVISSCLENDDLPLYMTHAHAIKSAAASIGADMLSSMAYDLEMACHRGDIAFVRANNGGFMALLDRLLDDISRVLSERDIGR